MNMMRHTFRRAPTISCETITALIGDGWETYYQTTGSAPQLGTRHPFGLSFNGLEAKLDVSSSYPQCHQYLLAHIDEPDKTCMAMTSIVRFILDRKKHESIVPYVRTFEAGNYHFFEMGCRHGVYLGGHPIEIDEYQSKLRGITNMLDFLAGIWQVDVTESFLDDPAGAGAVCKKLKLLFC